MLKMPTFFTSLISNVIDENGEIVEVRVRLTKAKKQMIIEIFDSNGRYFKGCEISDKSDNLFSSWIQNFITKPSPIGINYDRYEGETRIRIFTQHHDFHAQSLLLFENEDSNFHQKALKNKISRLQKLLKQTEKYSKGF